MRINFEIQGGTGIESFRPQQGLPIMNKSHQLIVITSQVSFRPQQGLPIMNMMLHLTTTMYNTQSFRPQQGLPIMNGKIKMEKIINFGFRPQQGLPIMNPYLQNPDKHYLK